MPTKHLLIKGTVQGVFYRATARDVATELGVTGWVKNTAEGHVEAEVSGTEAALRKFVDWCRQGPSRAVVREVIVSERSEQQFESFNILRGR